MCDLGQGIYDDGKNEGIKLGISKGKKEGIKLGISKGRKEERIQSKIESVKILMKNLNVGMDKAMDLLDISKQDQVEYKKLLKQ